jgi:hypothetical protein
MTDYINIKGQNIEVVASDPSNPTSGQIWYNSTSQTLKGQGFAAGSWASATSMGTARRGLGRLWNTNSSFGIWWLRCLVLQDITEAYNGSSWTGSGTLNTARQYY